LLHDSVTLGALSLGAYPQTIVHTDGKSTGRYDRCPMI
jgi:hypothetical protein